MESSVEFTDFIQPICLPSITQNVKNVRGIVAGYGRPSVLDDPTKIPYKIMLTTDDLLECYTSYRNSSRVLSEKSFCANNLAGVLCNGAKLSF
jgi:hypothetical protein